MGANTCYHLVLFVRNGLDGSFDTARGPCKLQLQDADDDLCN